MKEYKENTILEGLNEEAPSKEKNNNSMDFKLFKCCSATLKRLSVLMFIVNLFIVVTAAVVAVIAIMFYMSAEMLSLLAVPIVCLVIVMVIFARLISALIYGFALIVEKHENK